MSQDVPPPIGRGMPLRLGVLLLLAVAAAFVLFHRGPKAVELERGYPVMGTWASVTFYGDKGVVERAADAVQDTFKLVEAHCSRFNPDSELSRLNASAFQKPFRCGDLLWGVLVEAKRFHELSGGSFDVTVTPLMELWGFYRKQNRLPSSPEVAQSMAKVGFDKVELDAKTHEVRFKSPGVQIDLGGIAKGYAVDLACAAAVQAGARSGVVNLGGNLRCLPEPPPGKASYAIGLKNPFDKEATIGDFQALDLAAATSGNYEKYVTIDGKRYTHIMDPSTGKPVTGSIAVTVVGPSATVCDALSTTCFVKGAAAVRPLLDKLGYSAFFICEKPGKPEENEQIEIGSTWRTLKRN